MRQPRALVYLQSIQIVSGPTYPPTPSVLGAPDLEVYRPVLEADHLHLALRLKRVELYPPSTRHALAQLYLLTRTRVFGHRIPLSQHPLLIPSENRKEYSQTK